MGTAALALTGTLLAALLSGPVTGSDERLYARVVTTGGEVYVGFVRWGADGAAWTDRLVGSKPLPEENFLQARRLRAESSSERSRAARAIDFMGVRVTWDEDDLEDVPAAAESGVRFGHLRSVTVLDGGALRLIFKSGLETELTPRPADRTAGAPALRIDTGGGVVVPLAWSALRSVDFMPAPDDGPTGTARLHGTVLDRRGKGYTGHFTWLDGGLLETDSISGRSNGRPMGLPLADVVRIERTGPSAARVGLATGAVLSLTGSGSATFSRRWVRVSDPALGVVQIPWNDLQEIRLHPPATPVRYEDFAGAHRLRGVVLTEAGERHEGFVRWDNDEEFTWEMLNGRDRETAFEVEFAFVLEIRRLSPRSASVTLRDGRTLELGGSNDVGWGNKGMIIEGDDGSTRLVEWLDFHEVRFTHP